MNRLESSPLENRIMNQEDADQLYRIYVDVPKSHQLGCPACGKNRGQIIDGVVELNGIVYQCNCRDQLQRQKHYLNSGIGMNYQVLSWNDFKGDKSAFEKCRDYLINLSDNIQTGRGLYLYGETYGSGKTMLATLVLKECIMRGYCCYSTTYLDMLSSLKVGWKDAEFASYYKSKIDSAQVLLLDDIGKELMDGSGFNNDFSRQTLDGLIRTRCQQSRPTFLTANISMSDIGRVYGKPLESLLKGTVKVVPVNGSDYRPNVKLNPIGKRRIY